MKKIKLINIELTEEQISESLKSLSVTPEEKEDAVKTLKERTVFKYKDALINAMRSPLDGDAGLTIEEVERSLNIIAAIKAAGEDGILELDDSDMDYLLLKLTIARVSTFDERWVTLKNTVKTATKDVLN